MNKKITDLQKYSSSIQFLRENQKDFHLLSEDSSAANHDDGNNERQKGQGCWRCWGFQKKRDSSGRGSLLDVTSNEHVILWLLQMVNRLLSDFNFTFMKQKVVSAVKKKLEDQETLTSQRQKLLWAIINMVELCRAIIEFGLVRAGISVATTTSDTTSTTDKTAERKPACLNWAHLCQFLSIKVDYKKRCKAAHTLYFFFQKKK